MQSEMLTQNRIVLFKNAGELMILCALIAQVGGMRG